MKVIATYEMCFIDALGFYKYQDLIFYAPDDLLDVVSHFSFDLVL